MAGKGQHPVPPGLMRTPAQVRGNKLSCLLAEQNHGKHFTVYKPNVGRQSQLETFDSLRRKFRRVRVGPGAGAGVQGTYSSSVLGLGLGGRSPGCQEQEEQAWAALHGEARMVCPSRWLM